MSANMGRYRYWGDQKPDTSRPLLTFTRPSESVSAKQSAAPVASTSGTATIRIYGPIDSWGGFWGVSAKDVAQALDLLGDVDRIIVRVNSPGGESAEGRAIMNLLRAHSATCVGVVDGAAYSAASYIAVGCDEKVMSPGTTLMIHDTSSILYGNADAFRKAADVLDILSDSGAELYAEVAGGTVEAWRDRQRAETWYTAASAVESGLMDRVAVVPDAGVPETAGTEEPEPAEPDAVEERARATYDLSLFVHPPKPPSASAVGSPPTQEGSPAVAFSDEQVTTMRQQLGIAEDADEATILAALTEVLDEQTAPAAPPAEIPEGHVVIPAAKLADLEAGAATASAVAKKLAAQERDAFLDSVRTKYLPTSRAAWEAEYDRNPEGTRAHFETAIELIPTAELGTGDAPELTEDDALYAELFGAEKTGA